MAQTPTTTKLITQVPHMKTLAMYRRSLKAFMTIFKDDFEMFHRARIEFRRSIESQKDERELAKVNDLLFQYEETRRTLLQKVVQGNLQQDGSYRWKVRPEHAMGSSVKDTN